MAKNEQYIDKVVGGAQQQSPYVFQKTLPNGMNVVVRPDHFLPKVSAQVWYHVGSKDEVTGEKGLAHLIEHMLFKGTGELSESDINFLVHKLSGDCNAFTAQDYTGYLFNFPTHHWKISLSIMADCMRNAAFKEDHLSSEMKAVIQELKMRRDNNTVTLLESLQSAIFSDHPYHYPIIGYKQDLWNAHADDLRSFYTKHYVPNNATLVIVGDVDPEEVFALAQQYFASIPADPSYKKTSFPLAKDIIAKSVTLYRDVKQPICMMAYSAPGEREQQDHALDIASYVLGAGRCSRLYRKLVENEQLVASIRASSWRAFDASLFLIIYEPKNIADQQKIETLIAQEIDDIAKNGLRKDEFATALRKAKMSHYSLLEDVEQQAYLMGKSFLATGDPDYIFTYLDKDLSVLARDVQKLFATYLRPSVAHKGQVVPLPEVERQEWLLLQQLSDKEDERVLSAHQRISPVEPPRKALTIGTQEPQDFVYPKAQIFSLKNGLKVLHHENKRTPTIDIVIEFPAKHYYDSKEQQGLYAFMSRMLKESSKNYSSIQFADERESLGISLSTTPGVITLSMMSDDAERGLELLYEALVNAAFTQEDIEKVRAQQLIALKAFWDEPKRFASQIIKEQLYKGHPYSNNELGTQETVSSFTREDLMAAYKKYITPSGATLAIVGDISKERAVELLGKVLGKWTGPEAATITFPVLAPISAETVMYPIARDQVLLCFAGLSVTRKDQDFDKLALYDQIFGGGMHSKLFQLREQMGTFYSIGGRLTSGATEQPGMVLVTTKVSVDSLADLQERIKKVIDHGIDDVQEKELVEARDAIVNGLVQQFESNESIAHAFLFLNRYDFPATYFDDRKKELTTITVADMQNAVKKVLQSNRLMTFTIGRVSGSNVVS